MKAFVTGSTGMVGGNLVRQLLQQGWEVKALARSPEKARRLLGNLPNVEIVSGDIADIPGFAEHLTGVDVVFHTAAYFRESYGRGNHWEKLVALNVDATVELFDEAEKRGVKKAIYVSTAGTVGKGVNGQPADENTPADHYTTENLYYKSKLLSEQAVAKWSATHSLPIVTILPGWIMGPLDAGPTGSAQFILSFLRGQIPSIFDASVDIVDARDVAQAMINAVERGRAGERYIVSGKHTTFEELLLALSQVTGLPAPTQHTPTAMVIGFARLSETIAHLRGTDAPMPVAGLLQLTSKKAFSSQKAIRELGVSFHPLKQTLYDAIEWMALNQPKWLPEAFALPEPA